MKDGSNLGQRWHLSAAAITAVSLAAVLYAADDLKMVSPPPANPETPPASGIQTNATPSNFSLQLIAQGSDPLENPSGVIQQFGLLNDAATDIGKTRTEPDENTYLEFDKSLPGPAHIDYGHHFLFQGHENAGNRAYITRINLDVTNPAHRITLLTPVDPSTGLTGLNAVDGSTWYPTGERLLFTEERGVSFSNLPNPPGTFHISSPSIGRVIELDPAVWPPAMRTLECVIGFGGWEGVHPDDEGNLILAEDAGGIGVSIDPANPNGSTKVAKQPNSFMYRFEPNDPSDLGKGGKLFALQVEVDGSPLVFWRNQRQYAVHRYVPASRRNGSGRRTPPGRPPGFWYTTQATIFP